MAKNQDKYVARAIRESKKNKGVPKVIDVIGDYEDADSVEIEGDKYGKCSVCGKTFEQPVSPNGKKYLDLTECPDCRKKIESKGNTHKKEVEVSSAILPFHPYPWQMKAFEDFKTHRFNLWACGNRCLLENDFIQGCNKLVQDVQVGDKVYSQYGEEQLVTAVGTDDYTGYVYHVKGFSCLETVCNEEHPFLVCDVLFDPDEKGLGKKTVLRERFVKAKDIEKETYQKLRHGKHIRKYYKIPRIKKTIKCTEWVLSDGNVIPLNEDTAWLFGLYCAEGCQSGSYSKLTLNYQQPWLAERAKSIIESFGYYVVEKCYEQDGVRLVKCYRSAYRNRIADEIGRGSQNKHIPESILFNENKDILVSFLKGYFAGDGWYNVERSTLTATTVSRRLAEEIQMAFIRLGCFAGIGYYKRNKSKTGDYNIFVTDPYGVELMGYESKKVHPHQTAIKIGDDFYVPLQKVTKEWKTCKIYFFSTQDGTFIHNNQVNHNSGKDFCANMIGIWYFVQCLNENRAVLKPTMAPSVQWWIIAPTEPMAAQNWRDLKKQFPKEWIVSVRDSDMVMNTVGNGLIEVKSAFNAENLVGVGLDLVTITEAARVKNLDVVWGNIEPRLGSQGRGLIADRKGGDAGAGKAIINSTPIGKNFFYTMWKWGQEGTDEHSSEWISYQLPWTVNPTNKELADRPVKTRYGVMSYEEDIRRRIGERLFRQNYLADFLAGDGSVFKDFDERCVKRLYDMGLNKKQQEEYVKQWKDPIPYHSYRIGYDPATGSSSDTPAVIVRDMNTNNIVLVADLYGKNYDQQWDEIAYISRYYNYAPCAWLRTGHTAIENQLAKRGVVEIPLDEQGGKKAQYIQSLERAIQNDDLHVLLDGTQEVQTFVMQMGDYSEHDGKYSNEAQPHDDFVSACYAAYYDYSDATEKVFYCGLMGSINRYGNRRIS